MKQWICETCGEPCDVVEGYEEISYEYGSSSGNHRVYFDISDCCHAEVSKREEEDKDE